MVDSSTSPSHQPNPDSPFAIKSPTSQNHPHLSLGLLNPPPSSPTITTNKKPPYVRSSDLVPLQEFLLLPPSPHRKPKSSTTQVSETAEMEEQPSPHRRTLRTRNSERAALLEEPSPRRRTKIRVVSERVEIMEEPVEQMGPRKRCKNRASPMGLQSCASPRNVRRSRRRLEPEIVQNEKETVQGDEVAKPKKRRQSSRSRKEKTLPESTSSPRLESDEQMGLDHIKQLVSDLVMWKDVAKSSLWFGFGSLCFLSSCSSRGLGFSIFSGASHLGLLFLALSFFSNSISQRVNNDKQVDFKLQEDDILRVARRILPVANFVVSKTREVFSGDPSTTLKVAPILLFGAEYGHLITLWRLCATGFFLSFTAPKLYSCYSMQINRKVESLGGWLWETWRACSHKKIVGVTAASAFWNLSSLKTRVFTAFVCMVLFRYYRQNSEAEVLEQGVAQEVEQQGVAEVEQEVEILEKMEIEEEEQQKQDEVELQNQALVVVAEEGGSHK